MKESLLSNSKQKYWELSQEIELPIFMQPLWLNITNGNNWDVVLVEKGGRIIGAMPFTIKKKFLIFNYLGQPPLTQHLGPWIRPSEGKYAKWISHEKDVLQALIEQLPDFDNYMQNWSYKYQNWLPFYWKGFQQTTKYTYVIENLTNLDEVFCGFKEKVKTDIRKASGRNKLVIREDTSIEVFFELNKKVFERQSKKRPYSDNFLKNLIKTLQNEKKVKWFVAYDEEERPHAGVLIVWDKDTAYYLMGGGDPKLRNSGATSLCIWEAIKFASTIACKFDFEGSMVESIERFIRGYGATQKQYFNVSKTNSKILNFILTIKSLII